MSNYCAKCDPRRSRTEGSPVDNICSPRELLIGNGHTFCFNCGRKLKAEATPAMLIKKVSNLISWQDIAEAKKAGTLNDMLVERDVVDFKMKNGNTVSVQVEKVGSDFVWFGFVDCPFEGPMYDDVQRPVSWANSDARRRLNNEHLNELPDDLIAIIQPRTIKQTVQGKEYITEDKLWLHSMTELFGRHDWAEGDDPNEEQLAVYASEKDRVKMIDNETRWHYTRSVYSSASGYFCGVTTNGGAYTDTAYYSRGLAPGFCI